jgi:hypothetical protein
MPITAPNKSIAWLSQWLSDRHLQPRVVLPCLTVSLSLLSMGLAPTPARAQVGEYCQVANTEILQKNNLRRAAQTGDKQSQQKYQEIVKREAELLQKCRQASWLKKQALWIRLYPCDANPGALDEIFDRIIERGYNQVYIATFYTGQVLLPRSNNPTAWSSVINLKAHEKTDLLAMAIEKAKERGIKIYAWLYAVNFGTSYAASPEGQAVLGVNGKDQTTVDAGEEGVLFIDPHSDKAKSDYALMVKEVLRRRPDGVLIDYIRYPRGQGTRSVAGQVKDLWIYGAESRQTLEALAENSKGEELLRRYLDAGNISVKDLKDVDALFPDEAEPMWAGRKPLQNEAKMAYEDRLPWIQWDLWQLCVGHAGEGVVRFLKNGAEPAERMNLKAGAVFFPEGNKPVGSWGYDSRLQPWDRFPESLEWHPMVYATCNRSDCIVEQVKRVQSAANPTTEIVPALAGVWGKSIEGRPSLESQMEGIRRGTPGIKSISHFAFSWQEPELDYYRSACRLK